MFKFLDIFKTENQKTSDALRASLPILAHQAHCVNGNKSFTEVTSLLCN